MKQYTRREALKLFGIGTVAVAGLGLAGCSGSGEGVKNASEPVPASQAFGQAGVWMVYDGDEQIGKDVAIEEVLRRERQRCELPVQEPDLRRPRRSVRR